MPVKTKSDALEGESFEEIQLSDADILEAPQEGESIPAGELVEVARSEVGDDGQLSSYDMVQLGGHLSETGMDSQGKLFIDLRDTEDNAVDPRTEIRFVARPKNGNRRHELVGFREVRDLSRDDPRQRQPLRPVTNSAGNPQVVTDGRMIAVEVRNGAEDVEVSLENSTIKVPAQAGY